MRHPLELGVFDDGPLHSDLSLQLPRVEAEGYDRDFEADWFVGFVGEH